MFTGQRQSLILIRKKILYFDSQAKSGKEYLIALLKYLNDSWEFLNNGSTLPDKHSWEVINDNENTPQQDNGYDCGVFCCMFAKYIAKKLPLTFSQADVTSYRRTIHDQILNSQN